MQSLLHLSGVLSFDVRNKNQKGTRRQMAQSSRGAPASCEPGFGTGSAGIQICSDHCTSDIDQGAHGAGRSSVGRAVAVPGLLQSSRPQALRQAQSRHQRKPLCQEN